MAYEVYTTPTGLLVVYAAVGNSSRIVIIGDQSEVKQAYYSRRRNDPAAREEFAAIVAGYEGDQGSGEEDTSI